MLGFSLRTACNSNAPPTRSGECICVDQQPMNVCPIPTAFVRRFFLRLQSIRDSSGS